jgi:hypothetical protein
MRKMPATTTERKEPTWKILILIQGDYSIHLGKVTRVYSPETREFISGFDTEVKWRSDSGPCDMHLQLTSYSTSLTEIKQWALLERGPDP